MHLIDPPSIFASLEDWQEHLAELQAIKEPDQQVNKHIKTASKHIKAYESGGLEKALKLYG